MIIPLLTQCSICRKPKHQHDKEEHAFLLNESIPRFKGWHSFRRSLASNLYGLGIRPKIIQAILRHSDLVTTMTFYVETQESESREALDELAKLIK